MQLINGKDIAIKYSVQIKNPSGISLVKVYLSLPPEHLTQKNVIVERINPDPDENLDFDGNRVIFFENPSSIKIEVHCRFTAYEAVLDRENKFSRSLSEEEQKKYTQEEFLIKINDEIKELSRKIVKEESNPLDQAKLLFDWIIDNFRYRKSAKKTGNLTTLKEKKGDCGGLSFLFISFCRALGIPARGVFGWWSIGPGKTGPHAWAEFYANDYGWIPVDCAIAILIKRARKLLGLFTGIDFYGLPRDPGYYFGNIDNKRVIYSFGTDHQVPHFYPCTNFVKDNYRKFEILVNEVPFIFGKWTENKKILWLQPFWLYFEREKEDSNKYPSFKSSFAVENRYLEKIIYFVHILSAVLIIPFVLMSIILGEPILLLGVLLMHVLTSMSLWKGLTRCFYGVLAIVLAGIILIT